MNSKRGVWLIGTGYTNTYSDIYYNNRMKKPRKRYKKSYNNRLKIHVNKTQSVKKGPWFDTVFAISAKKYKRI